MQKAGDFVLSPEADMTAGRLFAIVTETFPPEINGVANTVSRFADGMLERGHQVNLVRPRQNGNDAVAGLCTSGDRFSTLLSKGVPLPGYPELKFGLPATALLKQRWQDTRPDAVYVATEGPLGWSAVRQAQRMSIPVISGFHTNFHSYSRYYGVGMIRRPVISYLRGFHNRTAVTIAPTRALQQELTTMGFRNVRVVSRGVDSALFSPEHRSDQLRRQWGLERDDIAVLCVGRIAPEKNLELAVKAYRAMHCSGRKMKLIFVGDGPARQRLARDNSDFIFSGMKTGMELAQYYASGDVLLFSSDTETFGNVVLEGMASGLVVLAFDYAAAAEHIQGSENGYSVPLNDDKGFVQQAMNICKQWSGISDIRDGARRHALENDWTKTLDRFEQLMSGVCVTKEV